MPLSELSLYTRLGGYDAIAAVVDSLLERLRTDPQLGRFWTNPRSVDTNRRERQLAVDFIAAAAGGPTRHTVETLVSLKVPEREKAEVLGFLSALSGRSSRNNSARLPHAAIEESAPGGDDKRDEVVSGIFHTSAGDQCPATVDERAGAASKPWSLGPVELIGSSPGE